MEMKRNIVIAFIAVAIFAPLFWMLMDRKPPYTIEQVEIFPHNPAPGDTIYLTFTVTKLRQPCSPGLIYRTFRDSTGKVHLYDPVQRSQAPDISEDGQFTRIATLPKDIAPGKALYRGTACYSCNPLQTWLRWPVCIATPETPFIIAEERKPMTPMMRRFNRPFLSKPEANGR